MFIVEISGNEVIKYFEFDTEKEAREFFNKHKNKPYYVCLSEYQGGLQAIIDDNL